MKKILNNLKNLLSNFNKIKKYDLLVILISSFILFMANLIAMNTFDLNYVIKDKYIIIAIFCISIIILNYKQQIKIKKNESSFKFVILWCILILSMIISKILNNETNFIDMIVLISIVPFFFFTKNVYNIKKHINIACILSYIPFLIILTSSNTLAIISTFIFVIFINMVIRKFADTGKIYEYMAISAIFLIIIYITKCRTALITALTIVIVNFIYLMIKINKSYKKKIIACLLVVGCIIILINPVKHILLNKYVNTEKNMLTGRDVIWSKILEDASLFGNNNSYFMERVQKADAHNVYFQILGHYGIITLSIYIIINIYLLIKFCKKKRRLEFFNFMFTYFIIGMFENILISDTRLIICNILFFICISNLLEDDKVEVVEKNT